MIDGHFLDECIHQFRGLKAHADKALAQTRDEHLFALLDEESNSIAIIIKHLAGNMRSRWTDFLTTDGEKPDRQRDAEFEAEPGDTREALLANWEDGWSRVFAAVEALSPADLERTIYIRGQAHTVVQAILRQLSHYSAHVGQIVLIAKHYAGPRWQTLSLPKKRSR